MSNKDAQWVRGPHSMRHNCCADIDVRLACDATPIALDLTLTTLYRKRPRTRPVIFMLVAVGLMYSTTAVSTALHGYDTARANTYQYIASRNMAWAFQCLYDTDDLYRCTTDYLVSQEDTYETSEHTSTLICINTVTLIINVRFFEESTLFRCQQC